MKPLIHVRRNAVAYAALFAAVTTGGAYAADQLTSKDIAKSAVRAKHVKDGQLTTKDVRDASLLADDFANNQLPRGERGPQGPEGPRGAPGEPGTSAFADAVPSGATVTGFFGGQLPLATGKRTQFPVSLPIPAASSLGTSEVNFAPGSSGALDIDPACTGTHHQPTAPAGRVCLYPGGASGVGAIEGVSGSSRHGFFVSVTSSGGNVDFVGMNGSWAYMAP
jgi:hypothetical protein